MIYVLIVIALYAVYMGRVIAYNTKVSAEMQYKQMQALIKITDNLTRTIKEKP